MIRDATLDDLDEMLPLACDFAALAKIEFEQPRVRQVLAGLIADHCCLVSEINGKIVGGIGGVLVPELFRESLVAQELFWYTDPKHRGISGGRLLLAWERWATANGANRISLSDLAVSSPQVAAMYAERGYRLVERTWARDIGE